jgi:hypothetical protein
MPGEDQVRYVVKPVYVDAIRFDYHEPDSLEKLEGFARGIVTRHGLERLPTKGPWVYLKTGADPTGRPSLLVIDHGDWIVRWDADTVKNYSPEEFSQLFDRAE